MGSKQRKAERHRQKRQDKLREGRLFKLRAERRVVPDSFPVHHCEVNANWEENGIASIHFSRRVDTGHIHLAIFLVDWWGMGLKDAFGRLHIPASEYAALYERARRRHDTETMEPDTARHLVYGGVQRARELGFALPRHYDRWTAVLGPLDPGVQPDMSLFGVDGRIRLVCDAADFHERLIGCTPDQFLARPDVTFVLGERRHQSLYVPADFEPVMQEAMAEVATKLADSARRQCFAKGISPSPLLDQMAMAMLTGCARISEAASECGSVHSLDAETRHEIMHEAFDSLIEFGNFDRWQVRLAMIQLSDYLESDPKYSSHNHRVSLKRS
jgi:hypothetical protein